MYTKYIHAINKKGKKMKLTKKIFVHGGSKAIILPKEFTQNLSGVEVFIEVFQDQVVIQAKNKLDTLESDPLFETFIQAIAVDALKHPENLKDLNDEASLELDELLKDVPLDDEE